MPPVGAPSERPIAPPPAPTSRESYLPQLRELDAPVPDLASTLTTPAAGDEAAGAAVSAPRLDSPVPNIGPDVAERRHQAARSARVEDRMRRERLARARAQIDRLGGADEYPRRHGLPDPAPRSYGNRLPQRQSLYDWAPASEEDVSEEEGGGGGGGGGGHYWNPSFGDASSSAAPTSRRRPVSSSSRIPELSRGSQPSELRNLALAQALRRHPRAPQPPHSRHDLLNLIEGQDRQPAGYDDPDHSRQSRLVRPPSMVTASDRRQRIPVSELRASVDAYRQRYLQNPSRGSSGSVGGAFEDAIRYLERLRFSESDEESLSLASRYMPDVLFATPDRHDFVLDTVSVAPPPETSWLRVGGVFEGSQHASGGPNTITRRLSSTPALDGGPSPVGGDGIPPRADAHYAYVDETGGGDPTAREDRWPVKVTIQSIDYSTMQLSGEMEAFDVPDRAAPGGKSSITTFLEGEIIDLNTFTLETKSFRAGPRVDGTYWRKLQPFRGADELRIVERLVSKRWLAEHISSKWILMRWKEKCFITPSDQRLGLTISGFYYISLRRADGAIEGLYYDPASAPYQHLVLHPTRRTFPGYEFR
ncbi:MAG: hypothetical protein M1832_004615 [Thelocarpon impressellum]|nr:MAG: hypothetical protein M1832_004615 [Thelocarpon impressellum]